VLLNKVGILPQFTGEQRVRSPMPEGIVERMSGCLRQVREVQDIRKHSRGVGGI
jgi:hypothetical protein